MHSMSMAFSLPDIVGRYSLVVDAELIAFIERAFVDAAPEAERESVRCAALVEARGATLELRSDGTVISASGGKELYRCQLAIDMPSYTTLELEKPGGQRVLLRRLVSGALEATQVGRPALVFERLVESSSP